MINPDRRKVYEIYAMTDQGEDIKHVLSNDLSIKQYPNFVEIITVNDVRHDEEFFIN